MSSQQRSPRHLRVAEPSSAPQTEMDTVARYLEEWLAGKLSLRPSTRMAYENHVRRYLIPHLGEVELADLRPAHIEIMYRDLTTAGGQESGLAVSTLRRIHATLMSALNTAVKRGLISRNPAATVELPIPRRSRMSTWNVEELRHFLHVTEHDRLHMLFWVLALLGLRRGEAVALQWEDIDLEHRRLRVEQSLVRVGGRIVLGPPKSSAGMRTVAVDDETARRLRWHACRQRLEVLEHCGTVSTPESVFTRTDGSMLDPAEVSRHFDRLIRLHGLRRIRLHDLRHTSASIGLASGESLLEVSRRLGHSSLSVTADIYSQISPSLARDSAERRADHLLR